jgi:hypothetical protein
MPVEFPEYYTTSTPREECYVTTDCDDNLGADESMTSDQQHIMNMYQRLLIPQLNAIRPLMKHDTHAM